MEYNDDDNYGEDDDDTGDDCGGDDGVDGGRENNDNDDDEEEEYEEAFHDAICDDPKILCNDQRHDTFYNDDELYKGTFVDNVCLLIKPFGPYNKVSFLETGIEASCVSLLFQTHNETEFWPFSKL